MKALIRGDEVYTENEWNDFTRNHLAWMTGTETDAEGNLLPGDGWTLVENYVAPTETSEASYDTVTEPAENTVPETVVIDGVTYTRTS